MLAQYKFTLQKYEGARTRHRCPSCGKAKQFTLYVDNEGQTLASHVGKCNREDKCGYHYTPREFFRDNPLFNTSGEDWKNSEAWKTVLQPPKPQVVDYLPKNIMEASWKHHKKNNFIRYLITLFGEERALELATAYYLGTSKKWQNEGGYSVVFWQVDRTGKVRQAKVMAYDPTTGKRLKAEGKHYVAFMGKQILKNKEANLQQCLFGEHLLPLHPKKPVALVESEKTAVIMAGIAPEAIWLATGGKNGARWTDQSVYQALEGRQVKLYPDLGAFDDWKEKGKILGAVCDYQISELLEEKAQGDDRQEGLDLADYFIKNLQLGEPQPAPSKELLQEPPKEEPKKEDPPGEELPEGFTISEGKEGPILEFEGLPIELLYKEEAEKANKRLKGHELAITKTLKPELGNLIECFGLEVEGLYLGKDSEEPV